MPGAFLFFGERNNLKTSYLFGRAPVGMVTVSKSRVAAINHRSAVWGSLTKFIGKLQLVVEKSLGMIRQVILGTRVRTSTSGGGLI